MATTEREILFRINAALSSQFAAAMQAAQNQINNMNRQQRLSRIEYSDAMKALQKYQGTLTETAANVAKFKNLNQAIGQNSAALMQARLDSARLRHEYNQQRQQTDRMKQSFERLKEVYRENKNTMTAEQRATWQSQIQAAGRELAEQRQRERSALTASTGKNAEVSRLESQLAQQRQKLTELRNSLSTAGVNVAQLAQEEERLQREIDETNNALSRQEEALLRRQAVQDRHQAASEKFSAARDNFQNAMSTAQSIMSPFTDAVKVSMNFNKAMSEVQAITSATGEQFDAMKAKAKELGASTMFSASDVAGGMIELGKSGFNPEQINAAIASNLNLAAAGTTDLATSSKILSDALTMFKVDSKDYAKESEHFADVMAKTANSSNTSVELLGETFKYAGAVAGSLGYSFNDVAIAAGLMAKVGLNGSMAGTALRSTFTRLISPPKDAAEALAKLGVSAVTADGKVKPFRETLTNLREGFSKLTQAEKAEYATQIAGLEAQAGFLAMVDADEKTFREMIDSIDNSQGAAEQTAQLKTDNLAGAITTFQSAFEGLQIAIGDTFEEPLKNLVNFAASNLGAFTQWVSQHKELAQAAGVAAAAISGVIVAVAGYSVVSTGVEYLAASYQLLKMRILESAAAMRASATASSWSAIGAGISGAFTSLTAKIAAARAAMVSFFATAVATNGASITAALSSMGAAFLSAAKSAMAFIFSPVGAVLMAIALAGYYCYTHWSQVAPVFESLAATLGGSLQGAITTIMAAFESLGSSVSRLGSAFSNIGGAIFSGLAVALNFVVNIGATIISTFANAIAAVISLFGGLGNAIASALAGDWGKAAEHFKNAFLNAGKFVVEAIKSLFGGLADTFANFFKPLEIMSKAADLPSSDAVSRHAVQPPQAQQVDNSALIAAISTAVERTQKQNPEADWSKVTAAISTAVESVKQDPKADIAPLLQQVSTAIESVKKENPEADTAKLESVITAAISQIQAQQQAQQQAQPQIEVGAVQEAVNATAQIGQAAQNASPELLNLQNGAQVSGAELMNFSGALPQPIGGLETLGTGAGSAAGQLEQLAAGAGAVASALQAKAGEISSIHISVPTVTTTPIPANYSGGIYSKGSFLTTFAEKSPEAAIPIEKSQRAADLWMRTGQLLGLLPSKSFTTQQTNSLQGILPTSGEGIIPPLINNLPQSQAESAPIDLHFEINIAGNANAEEVEAGIRQTIPLIEETFEQKIANYRHEQQRRAF